MQRKINPKRRGFAVIFKKDALQFVSRWHKPMPVHEMWIHSIEIMAADPKFYSQFSSGEFWICYLDNPDLAAALLNFLRKKWSKLEKSKAGKLKKFLSQNSAIKWERGFVARPDRLGNVSLWSLQDGELATAFEHSPGGEVVTIEDVVKARKWVAANIRAGEKFAGKVLDKDGFLHVKGKPRRRK
jgi:hypothetical protein